MSAPLAPFAVRGHLALGGRLAPGAVVVEAGRIASILRDPRDGDLPATVHQAAIVSPGLIDLQVNGGYGAEVGDDPEAIRLLARRFPETGVTAFLPTVITAPASVYAGVVEAFAAAHDAPGARPLGLHLEGPLLSPARKGAHRRELIEAATPAIIERFAAMPGVRLVTLAPERDGALAAIQRLRAAGIVASLGHTDATVEQFTAGVDAGATMATHLFNAMSPFGHRAPGAIGGALLDDRIVCGLIPDGIHTHPASLHLALRAKGWERIAVVTDMMTAAGMPPGRYGLGGQEVIVDAASARLADGTLAGSVILMDQAVRNMVAWTGATPAEALAMTSEVPARVLGLTDRGALVAGLAADLALWDGDLQVQMTIVGGEIVYRREG